MYFRPRVIYRDPLEPRKNSIVRYVGNRVLRNNKNFMCAVTGQTGVGKSWTTGSMQEIYSEMWGVDYNPGDHVMFSLKQLMALIHNKDLDNKIKFGSTIMVDELQVEANSRTWQSETNLILNRLTSTFRNQRLTVFFCTPFIEMIDKQSRILFHAEFKILGFDKNTGIASIKPRFLEWSAKKDDFYRSRLLVEFALQGKNRHVVNQVDTWEVNKPSKQWIEVYELKKKEFSDRLNSELYKSLTKNEGVTKEDIKPRKENDLITINNILNQYGEDYIMMAEKLPHISPGTIGKYVLFAKTSKKAQNKIIHP